MFIPIFFDFMFSSASKKTKGFRQKSSLVEAAVQSIGYIGDSSGFRHYSQLKKLNENFILAVLTGDKRFIEENGTKHESTGDSPSKLSLARADSLRVPPFD
ncbi:MAG: hypothetical protein ACI4OX_07190 [Akkermansia sp.]